MTSSTAHSQSNPPVSREAIERVVAKHVGRCGALLGVMEELQNQNPNQFLPAPLLRELARVMGLPPAQVYSVATFYAFFNLAPQGKHTVAICRGTACHTRGSKPLLEALERALHLDGPGGDGERINRTTEDARFTLRTVACFGQCALAPVVELDRVIHGHMTEQKLLAAVERIETGDKR